METFTIITMGANDLVRPIHERMPLILSPAAFNVWLASGEPPMSQITQKMSAALARAAAPHVATFHMCISVRFLLVHSPLTS